MRLLRPVAFATALAYLLWRAAFTWSGAHPVLFGSLLLAEAFGVVRMMVELGITGDARRLEFPVDVAETPDSDIYVLVSDEPGSEVRASLLSAREVVGGASVTVVDPSSRRDIAEIAARLGLRRVVGGPDADAGDLLTDAFMAGDAEFAVVLPADIVVFPDLLSAAQDTFDDPEVGVLVGRVEATNAIYPIDLDGYGELAQRDVLMSSKLDRAHALPWWTGVSVVRREALEEIGGLVPARRDAMLATGVRLQVGGWRMADSPVVIGRRLAPSNDNRQLHRWARDLHERIAVLRRRDISWSSTRITPMMRLAYRSALIPAFRGVQRLVLLGVLFATAAGVGLPIVAPGAVLIGFWSLRMGLGVLARRHASRSYGFSPWITSDVLLMWTEMSVAWSALRRHPHIAELVDQAPGMRARAPFLVALEAGLLASLLSVGFEWVETSGLVGGIILVCSSWMLGSMAHAQVAVRNRQERSEFRSPMSVRVTGTDEDLTVVAMTPLDFEIVSSQPLVEGTTYRFSFMIPRPDGSSHRLIVSTVVRRVITRDETSRALLRFALSNDDEMDILIQYCSIVAGRRLLRGDSDGDVATVEWLERGPGSMNHELSVDDVGRRLPASCRSWGQRVRSS